MHKVLAKTFEIRIVFIARKILRKIYLGCFHGFIWKVTEKEKQRSVCWLTPQVASMTGAGPDWSQELGTPSGSPRYQGYFLLLSQVHWCGAALEVEQLGLNLGSYGVLVLQMAALRALPQYWPLSMDLKIAVYRYFSTSVWW